MFSPFLGRRICYAWMTGMRLSGAHPTVGFFWVLLLLSVAGVPVTLHGVLLRGRGALRCFG